MGNISLANLNPVICMVSAHHQRQTVECEKQYIGSLHIKSPDGPTGHISDLLQILKTESFYREINNNPENFSSTNSIPSKVMAV